MFNYWVDYAMRVLYEERILIEEISFFPSLKRNAGT